MEAEELDNQLDELEIRVERLRALYEQYFLGIEKMEPAVPRKDVDRRIWALRRVQIRNTAKRFRLHNIVQRYNMFQQYWQRICREIENGTYARHLMRAAKRLGKEETLTLAMRRRIGLSPDSTKPPPSGAELRQSSPPDAKPQGGPDLSGLLPTDLRWRGGLHGAPTSPPLPLIGLTRLGVMSRTAEVGATEQSPRPTEDQPRRHRVGPLSLSALPLVLPNSASPSPEPNCSQEGAAAVAKILPPHALDTSKRTEAHHLPIAAGTGPGVPALPAARDPAPGGSSSALPKVVTHRESPPVGPDPGNFATQHGRPLEKPGGCQEWQVRAKRPPTSTAEFSEQVIELHAKLTRAREQTGDLTRVSMEGLAKSLEVSTTKLRAQHGQHRRIEFDVIIQNGKAQVRPIVR